ncbi:MAG: GPW/gp25 family protein [Pseudomonadota bacterium]
MFENKLPEQTFLSFPFHIGAEGAAVSDRKQHVRELIEQVLLTDPGERVFRAEFGAGVRRLVFEPNDRSLALVAGNRLRASLEEALRGEVDPKTLEISTGADPEHPERLLLRISYELSAIGAADTITMTST